MKNNKLKVIIGSVLIGGLLLTGCDTSGSDQDRQNTMDVANKLQQNQQTPTDIDVICILTRDFSHELGYT